MANSSSVSKKVGHPVLREVVLAIVATLIERAPPAYGQNIGGAQRRPFRSGVDIIAMNVTVTDSSRRHVTDLDRQDFHVCEDGRPPQVTFFQKGQPPAGVGAVD